MSQEAAKAAKEASKGEDKEVRDVVKKLLRDVEKRVVHEQKAANSRDLAEISPSSSRDQAEI